MTLRSYVWRHMLRMGFLIAVLGLGTAWLLGGIEVDVGDPRGLEYKVQALEREVKALRVVLTALVVAGPFLFFGMYELAFRLAKPLQEREVAPE